MKLLPTLLITCALGVSASSAFADEAADVQAMFDDTQAMIDSSDFKLWSTTTKVKGIKRKDLMTRAKEAIEAKDYTEAKSALTLAQSQIAMAKQQAEDQKNGGWKVTASALLGIEQ